MNMPGERSDCPQAIRWLSWYGVGLASADRLPVVVRIPAGPFGSLKCDPPKGNGRRPQKKTVGLPSRKHVPDIAETSSGPDHPLQTRSQND